MKLKDLLSNNIITIEVRTFDPDGDDMLFGHCRWNGKELVSLDGDTYSVEDEVYKFKFDNPSELTYWFESEWI